MNLNPEILTISDIAALLQRSPGAVRSLISRQQIPFRRLAGRRIVFLKSEIDLWIQAAPGVTLEQLRERRQ